MIPSLLFLILSLGCLIVGSYWLIRSLKFFSLWFKLSPLFLSIVVLGFVSSSPEWFVTLTASLKGLPDAALGNILGSNVINILLVLSLTGLFYKFSSNRQIVRFDMPVLIVGSLMLGLFLVNQKLVWWEGLLMLGFFVFYLILLFQKRKETFLEELPDKQLGSVFTATRDLVLGFVFLFLGSFLSVDSSLSIVQALSLSERFAGVFILSLSTSLPELVTSMQAVFKKEEEMALGNIVGSNIFNTLFVLGSASLVNSFHFSHKIFYDYFFMLFVTVIFWLGLLFFKKIPKWIFAIFIVFYFMYIAFVAGV